MDNNESALKKPKCKLSGTDGNVFALIAKVSSALEKAGLKDQAEEMRHRCFKAQSYEDAIGIMGKYVRIS